MKIIGLKDLKREEGYIYYRRNFLADAVVEIPGSNFETPIKFCIETTPLGTKNVEIELSNSINYPLLPVKKALKEYILTQDKEGKLPLWHSQLILQKKL